METKYYRVQAKCGHVGRNHYILKWFYVKAFNGKEAAKRVRQKPRVKHDHKDAIQQVFEITLDEYLVGLKSQLADKYFQCSSRQEQETSKCVMLEDIIDEIPESKSYKKRRNGQRIKNQLLVKQMEREIRSVLH